MKLKETVEMMVSDDYKERFKAEYYQLKERYEKLKKLNTRIELAKLVPGVEVIRPEHDCPDDMLKSQQQVMLEYLDILECRAIIENIEL